ncbi:DUF1428 domain-containing protein [Pontivivens ytuae]|uniref:DUF1428 domain-containing protein n=1 Tax=Pontivivens ytuae TaxID=2789856 RepID=A0A7S9QDH5_9RHOB|nr:DUF1428 domain-containing protein [Pontivivens ytuae]QPH54998.1 DUF1428 domain-containing protein [Pontivivens ytuae]
MYVDGFVVPVKADRIEEYRAAADEMADLYLQHGALSVVETVADDVPVGELTSFPRAVQLEADETVVLSWITYPDRATRDAANAAVTALPRAAELMTGDVPLAGRRMIFGGFTTLLQKTA